MKAQAKKRAPAACKARYVTLLQALAGAQSGNDNTPSNNSGVGPPASQPPAPISPALQGHPTASAVPADASQVVQQRAQDNASRTEAMPQAVSQPQQVPSGARPLWETVGVLRKGPVEQQLGSSIQAFGAGTLAASVEAAAAPGPAAERALPLPQPSATAIAAGIQVSTHSVFVQGLRPRF